MKRKHKNRKLHLIGWTFLCLVAGYAAATLVGPVTAPNAQTTSILPNAPGSFSGLVKKAKPSVVNISTIKIVKSGRGPMHFGGPSGPDDPFKDFFDRFFRDQLPRDFKQRSLGSGFIIDKEGYILTNNHVVEKADEISVKLSDDTEVPAEIIGRDPKTDLALIRIKTDRPLSPLPLGDSDKLEVGDWVLAIGNPYSLGNTVTSGIVSAKYRRIHAGPYDNF
ncbi:MAG: trypsin-like serine protease, partial [Desulfobacterales bacterium]|nr:trypsin-like serine protease [Desulfobacterales bacterium]